MIEKERNCTFTNKTKINSTENFEEQCRILLKALFYAERFPLSAENCWQPFYPIVHREASSYSSSTLIYGLDPLILSPPFDFHHHIKPFSDCLSAGRSVSRRLTVLQTVSLTLLTKPAATQATDDSRAPVAWETFLISRNEKEFN